MAKLTYQQKLDALSYRFYQGGAWTPKAGDFYTTSRADLELYQVVSVENGIVRTCYTEGSDAISEWPEAGFLTDGFGPRRVFVPAWVICTPLAPAPHLMPSESPWQWWAGSDEEWCTVGPESTREDIIQAATNDSLGEFEHEGGGWNLSFHIIEARQDPLRLADWIEADRLLERADEGVSDSDRVSSEYDDGPWFECTQEQEKDLVERVKRACDEWQAAHQLVFSCATFSHVRNKEHVIFELPSGEGSEASDNG